METSAGITQRIDRTRAATASALITLAGLLMGAGRVWGMLTRVPMRLAVAVLAVGVFALAGVAAAAPTSTADAGDRPQEPRPPFPYQSDEVSYRSGPVELAGTLTYPSGGGPFAALLMLTGSGPQDRDETILGHKPFAVLADTLTRAGYAVLRVDDRGVGGSSGDLSNSTYEDLTADALAGVEYLQGRPEIDPKRIGLFGHSEGGYIAPLTADRSDDVAFVILMAGPAAGGEEVVLEQNRLILRQQGATPEMIEEQLASVRELARLLRAGDYPAAEAFVRDEIERESAALPPDQRPTPEQIEEDVRSTVSPIIRSLITYDPAPTLTSLEVPVFAFFGGTDLQVPPAQSEPLMRTLLEENPDATVRVFEGLNHLMQPSATGDPAEYEVIETTIAPVVLDAVVDWLDDRYDDDASGGLLTAVSSLLADVRG